MLGSFLCAPEKIFFAVYYIVCVMKNLFFLKILNFTCTSNKKTPKNFIIHHMPEYGYDSVFLGNDAVFFI